MVGESADLPPSGGRRKLVVFVRTSSTARIPVYEHLSRSYRLVMMHPEVLPEFAHCFEHWISCETVCAVVLEGALRRALVQWEGPSCNIPDAIVSFDEYGVYPAAILAGRFSLRPIPMSPQNLQATSIKSRFRAYCAEHGIAAPRAVALHSVESCPVKAILSTGIQLPVVVKLSPGASSIMTCRCDTLEELESYVPQMWRSMAAHPLLAQWEALGTKVHVLIEEYIGGQEVDMDCVVENGRIAFCAVSDNFEVRPPYFQEQGGLTPSALPENYQDALHRLLKSFVESHGTEVHGVLHFEAKYDFQRAGAYVIEVNVRPGSAETHTMIKTVYGVTLGECLVRLALSESLAPLALDARPARCWCASVNLYPSREGVLSKAMVDTSNPALVWFQPCPIGSTLAPPPKSFGLLAWMVARGDTREAAMDNIVRLTQSFKLSLRCASVLRADNDSFHADPEPVAVSSPTLLKEWAATREEDATSS